MADINARDRQEMRILTNAAWWKGRSPVWSGVRNDLERMAKEAEHTADSYRTSDPDLAKAWQDNALHLASQAALANHMVTVEALKLASH